jgi:hypothetical protein
LLLVFPKSLIYKADSPALTPVTCITSVDSAAGICYDYFLFHRTHHE